MDTQLNADRKLWECGVYGTNDYTLPLSADTEDMDRWWLSNVTPEQDDYRLMDCMVCDAGGWSYCIPEEQGMFALFMALWFADAGDWKGEVIAV